jgi:DNA-binding CsgD family transcriptional regulator
MAEISASGLAVTVELAGIAANPSSIEQRAEAVVDQLRRVVPFEAIRIGLLDPDGGAPVSLVSRGYDEAVNAYSNSPVVLEEFELLGTDRAGRPVCIRDLPVPPGEVRGWVEYLQPAGFREGLSVGLFAPDGRHVGILGLNTDTEAHPTEAARDLIGLLAPLIASAVDPLRSIVAVAGLVGDAVAGIVLTRAGNPMPVPGLPTHRLLSQGSPVLDVVAQRLDGPTGHGSFLCRYSAPGQPDDYVRVTAVGCAAQPPHHLVAVVLVGPPGNLRGLTGRELQILGLLVDGWPNARIAAALVVAPRTVAAHVEHILAKLGARSRALAAVRAQRQGLYVPHPLAHPPG